MRNDLNQTASTHTHKAESSGWRDWVVHRWPTVLGIAVTCLTAFSFNNSNEFALFIVFMALVYLAAASLNSQRSAWVVLVVGCASIAVLRLLNLGINLSIVVACAAVVFCVLGLVRGQWHRFSDVPLQTIGMVGWSSIALFVLYANATLGSVLVAGALLGHAAWDAFHFWRNKVVARSYAEFCAVLDLLLGVTILVSLVLR